MRGFTLIELLVVVVVLGVLAATALPRFTDMSDQAQAATTTAVAGALTSASAVNYAARKVNRDRGQSVSSCSQAANLLAAGLPSAQYSLGTLPIPIPSDETRNCVLYGPHNTQAVAHITGIL